MNLLLIAGHGAGDPGAVWNGRREADETRRLAADVQQALSGRCTVARYPEDRNAYSDYQAGRLTQTAQFSQYDAVLELHFNACAAGAADGKPKGVEAYVTTTETETALASALCGALEPLGFPNRGVKRQNWAVIAAARRQGVPAVLLEVCFLDDGDDMALYDRRYDEVVAALADAAAETLGWKGEKPMTYEEFTAMMERYERERAAAPAADWSAQARAWCETGGVLNDGRYGSHVTREELAQALYNLAGKGR
ncbi:N-acetylmuramoyl-L-alanine amidase [Candidatus Avoscillospira sp. LCP25S3_F1]|uniref:N-acetylmuramoyl-L-alanine amidase n=1 Tax=Candidatus Avoscillospira sp. LCP25S3_F1 TaxID=3438825 RepID=UPI003F8DC80F